MKRGIGNVERMITAVIALLLIGFALIPLVLVLGSAFASDAELTDAATLRAAVNTLILSLAVTTFAVLIGSTLAYLLERTDVFATDRTKTRLVALLSLPLAIPPYLFAIAWALLANGRNGLLNRATSWIEVYGLGGTIFVLSSAAYPFALLSVRATLRRADPSLEEAARVAGAPPLRVIRDVVLPLATPAIAAAAGLIFVFAAAAFGVPYLLGTSADPPVPFLTTRIYHYVTLGGREMLEKSAALSLALLAMSVVAQTIASWVARRRSTVQVGGKAARPSLVALGRARRPIAAAIITFAILIVVIPIITIVWTSLQRTFADPMALTTLHWRGVLSRSETLRAFAHSIVLALGAGAIVAIAGFFIARVAKATGRTGEWLATAASVPYAVPGTVLAIGLILTFAREIRLIAFDYVTLILHLPGTLGMLLAAYTVKHLAFGVRGARAALDQLHPSLEEAARTSGASAFTTVRHVTLPLVAPALAAAFLLVALPCLSELTMSVLLFGAGTETTGTLLFELQSYADPPAAAVVASLVVAIAVVGDASARALDRRMEKR